MLIKITFQQSSLMIKSELLSLDTLVSDFKKSAKLPEEVQINFVFTDPSGENIILLSDQDLQGVKEYAKNQPKYLLVLEALETTESSVPAAEEEDTEVLENNNSEEADEFQLVQQQDKKTNLIPEPPVVLKSEEEQSATESKKAKKLHAKEKIQKMVQKEIKKHIPSITEMAKSLVLKELNQPAPSSESLPKAPSSSAVHPGFICDGCDQGPIEGVRYKCVSCQDYDLCEKCEEKGTHQHHAFLKIRRPELAPQMIACVEADQDAQEALRNLPEEDRFKVVDIDFLSLFGCPNKKKCQRKDKKKEKKDKKNKTSTSSPTDIVVSPVIHDVSTSIPEIVASVVGGQPSDYSEICTVLQGFSADEIIEAVLANLESIDMCLESSTPVSPHQSSQSTSTVPEDQSIPKPEEKSIPKPEEKSIPKSEEKSIPKSEEQSTPNPEEPTKDSIPAVNCPLIQIAKLIASLVDSSESLFPNYIQFVKENENKSVEELIDLVFSQQFEKQQNKEADKPVKEAEKPVEEPIKKCEESQRYPPALKKKAEQVAEIMGGKFEDFINIILNKPSKITVQAIVEHLLSESNIIQSCTVVKEQKEENPSKQIEEKKPVEKQVHSDCALVVEKREEVAKEVEEKEEIIVAKEEQNEMPKKKILKKKFSPGTIKRAGEVAEVLGGTQEDYFGIVDQYCLSSTNDVIEIILNNPEVIITFSSFI